MISLADFLGRPKTGASQFFPGEGGGRTVLVTSHIWWVDCIAYAFIRLGWNVLITEPWYSFFTNDELHRRFNVMHLPLATEPVLWPQRSVPLARREIAVNFLGNCFHHENWETAHDPQVVTRATAVGAIKAANLDLPMVECVGQAAAKGGFPAAHFKAGESDESLRSAFSHWATLEMVLRQRLRYDRIRALAAHLGSRLVICGKGWQALGIKPHKEHSGMPLRPFEIACSGGLIVTQHNRELPELFEPRRECLAFRDNEEMIAQIDRVLASPGEFDHMIEAARQRTLARHTWRHRIERLLQAVEERFALSGRPSAVPSTMVS